MHYLFGILACATYWFSKNYIVTITESISHFLVIPVSLWRCETNLFLWTFLTSDSSTACLEQLISIGYAYANDCFASLAQVL